MKKCFKCRRSLPLENFYKHSQMADGHLNKCIDCIKNDVRLRVEKLKKTDPNWIIKERSRCRTKYQKYKYKPNRESHNIASKKWSINNIEKKKIHAMVYKAVQNGQIIKPLKCEGCGNTKGKLEAHHEDYNKPLEVKWLCAVCHGLTKRKD